MSRLENIKLCREIASAGFVLLENENHMLPFEPSPVAVFGVAQEKMRFYAGGAVSVSTAPYYVDLISGLCNSAFQVDEELLSSYRAQEDYYPDEAAVHAAAKRCRRAIFIVERYTGEGEDHACFPGDFLLSEKEMRLLGLMEKANFEETLFLINAGTVIDLSPFHAYRPPKSMLLVYLPGMEGGNAIADVVTGVVNPSGKLPDTIAAACSDYPGTERFWRHPYRTEYNEDIYVGYRYFETFAPEKVLYPFGFGLSYTEFEIQAEAAENMGEEIRFACHVRNCGKRAGREVVQWYLAAETNGLERPARTLAAYAKTPLLNPGESCRVEARALWKDLAAFDDRADSPDCGAWVLEAGKYRFFCGSSVRAALGGGVFEFTEKKILSQCGILLQETLGAKLTQKGTLLFHPDWETLPDSPEEESSSSKPPELPSTLALAVEAGVPLKEFVKQFSIDELIHLLHAQGITFPHGTAGIGNLPHRGVPNVQTCDGAAGLHISTEALAFPCGTLLAATWDCELQTRFGKALAQEAYDYNCDVVLGPGVNLHRTPFCGRNAEYYAEDPLLSGRTGGAVIRGMQSEKIAATLKHFAANNRETNRRESDSIVSERALRELYLKSFEFAIREGDPLCLMTAYNSINGRHTSACYHLLTTILRKEWNSRALVMTDWRTLSGFLEEILAGCNLRMPLVPDDVKYRKVREAYDQGVLSRRRLESMACEVLHFITETRSFKEGRNTPVHWLSPTSPTRIGALDFSEVTATRTRAMECSDPEKSGLCHGKLCRDYGGNDVRIIFRLGVGEDMKFRFRVRAALPGKRLKIALSLERRPIGEFALEPTMAPEEVKEAFVYDRWSTQGDFPLALSKGIHEFTLRVMDPDHYGASLNFLEFLPVAE